jgi:hypothetical protein
VTAAAVVWAFKHLSALGPRYDTLSCSSGAKMLQRHERCATTIATATARVDLARSCCAGDGVGPCRMARVVVKNGTLVR